MQDLNSPASNPPFSAEALIERSGWGTQHVLVVFMCMFINMLDGFDITAMAVVVGFVGDEMQIAEDKLGLLFSFSLAGMMLGAMFLASLADMFGRRKVIIVGVFIVGFSVLATAYAENLWSLIIFRFISGLGAGAMLASQTTLTSEYSPEKYRALSVAIVVAGYPLGAMVTGIVAEYVVPDYGWRSIFLLGGICTLLIGIAAIKLLPESLQFLVKKRPSNALEKVNHILQRYRHSAIHELPPIADAANSEAKVTLATNISALFEPSRRLKTILLWTAFITVMCSLYFLLSWLPKLMINHGFSGKAANFAFVLFNLGGVAGIFVMGALATKNALSQVVSGFLVSAAVLMFVLAFTLEYSYLINPLVLIIGVLLQGGFTGLYALSAKLYPVKIRGTGVGWSLGVGRLGAVFGPLIAGFMIAAGSGLNISFMFFALPVIAGAFCVKLLHIK